MTNYRSELKLMIIENINKEDEDILKLFFKHISRPSTPVIPENVKQMCNLRIHVYDSLIKNESTAWIELSKSWDQGKENRHELADMVEARKTLEFFSISVLLPHFLRKKAKGIKQNNLSLEPQSSRKTYILKRGKLVQWKTPTKAPTRVWVQAIESRKRKKRKKRKKKKEKRKKKKGKRRRKKKGKKWKKKIFLVLFHSKIVKIVLISQVFCSIIIWVSSQVFVVIILR